MTGTEDAAESERATAVAAHDDGRLVDDHLAPALALLGCWMTSVLGFAGLVVALVADLPPVVSGLAAVVWVVPGVLAAPLMLYDAHAIRDAPAAGGFRFDAFWTGVVLFLVYPFGLPIYLITRVNGAYVAAIDADPGEMDLGDEFEFGIEDLVDPAADGVPSVWPTVVVLFLWGGVVVADGALLLAALTGGTTAVLAAAVATLLVRLLAAGALALDLYLLSTTGYVGTRRAVGIGLATAVLLPLAAVAYLPYRLTVAYGPGGGAVPGR